MNRQPYHGPKRRLVLAFDLGTTFSGVSYAILDPGKVPEIKNVARYPGQEAGDLKIPTIICYDALGNILSMGAEAPSMNDEDDDASEEDNSQPTKLEWFKLLMRPKGAPVPDGIPHPKLPPSKDIVAVYADFYRYLFDRAQEYICQTHASKGLFWESVKGDVDFILSHPNGWEGPQQSAMRKAAVQAGLVPDTPEGHERVTFVTEGEASFHYCISSGKVSDVIQAGNNVMVIDAGGGTVDLSTYTFAEASPLKIKEIAAPGCIFQGSVMVRTRFTQHVTAKLRNSRFGAQAYIDDMAEKFDDSAKKLFKGTGPSSVKFSNFALDKDKAVGIRSGQIKLSADEVCSFFDPSVKAIVQSIGDQQREAAPSEISTYFLVGGFSASEYLYKKLDAYLTNQGQRLFRPDSHANKAVAEGAVSFHIDHFVSTRVAKLTYGTDCAKLFMPWIPSHRERISDVVMGLDNTPRVGGCFESILKKGTEVSKTTKYEETFQACSGNKDNLNTIECDIICYRGNGDPRFLDEEPAAFSNLCSVTANLADVPKETVYGPRGRYYTQRISVVLELGLTELKAHLAWDNDGKKHRGPATIIYNDDSGI